VQQSVRVLETFPLIGPGLPDRWDGLRFLVGPWRWLVIVYRVVTPDRVVVVAIHDVRSSSLDPGSA
jgi:hypothetical protein